MESIETSDDLEHFLALNKALLLLAPAWSLYLKRVEELLKRNEAELTKRNVSLRVCRADLCPVREWLEENTKNSCWAVGAGTIVAIAARSITGSADAPWSWTEKKILDWISTVLPE